MKSKTKWILAGPVVLLATMVFSYLTFGVVNPMNITFAFCVIFTIFGFVGGVMLTVYGIAEKGTLDGLTKWMNQDDK